MTTRGISVVHVAQPLELGVPRVAAELVADQLERGWRVAVACPERSELRARGMAAGAAWHCWEATRSPGRAILAESRALARVVTDVDADLVHLHSSKAGLVGRVALRGSRPTIFQPHSWSFEAVDGAVATAAIAWERLAARFWTDRLLCVSEDERRRGREVGVNGKYVVLPNGVDLDAHRPATADERASARSRLGLGPEPLAVCVGRLFVQKGYDVLLRAWPAVREHAADAHLRIVGVGPEQEALEGLLSAGAALVGRQSAVEDWLAAADVVVIPSRWEAGLTRVAMEAMATGRSVVASDVAGMQRGLSEGAGVVVPVGATEPLARALAERLLDPELAAAEGTRGRATVERRYDLRDTRQRVADLCVEVVEDRRAGSRAA